MSLILWWGVLWPVFILSSLITPGPLREWGISRWTPWAGQPFSVPSLQQTEEIEHVDTNNGSLRVGGEESVIVQHTHYMNRTTAYSTLHGHTLSLSLYMTYSSLERNTHPGQNWEEWESHSRVGTVLYGRNSSLSQLVCSEAETDEPHEAPEGVGYNVH